jgi:outer membrane cobalamin receptor
MNKKILPYLLLINIFSFSLYGKEISLSDTIFITASRIETKIKSLPLSTQLITKNEIALKSIGDVASALEGIAGIDIRNYSLVNGASTINLLGSTSQQVLVLLDGLPINSPSVGTPDLGLISVNTLDRIEIVKGPTSSLYGTDALGGVVNFITENPFNITKNPTYNINLSYGSHQTYIANLDVKSVIRNFFFTINGHRLKTNGLRTNDDALAQGINLLSGYVFDVFNKVRLNLWYENKELGLPGPKPDTSQHPIYGDSTCFTRYDRQFDTLYLIRISTETQIIPNLNLNFNTHYIINNSRFVWVDQYSLDTSLFQDFYHTKTLNGNIITRYQFTKDRTIALGTDYEHNVFSAYSQYPQDTSWNPHLSKIGLFSEGSFDFAKIFRIFGSLRFDFNSGFGNFLSPAIGITSEITPQLKLRAHLGKAFRAPTLNDLYWPNSGNTKLKPEIGSAYQFGFDFAIDKNLSLSATAFARRTKNLISWTPDTSGIWRPENIDSSSIIGLEWSAKYNPFKSIFVQCSGTLQNAKQISKEMVYYDWLSGTTRFDYRNRKQAFSPDFTLSTDISYQSNWRTTMKLSGKYTSSRNNYYPSYDSLPKITMQTKTLQPHITFSFSTYQKLFRLVNLILKVDNILNARYAEQFGNSIIDNDYPRPGRCIFIGLEIKN